MIPEGYTIRPLAPTDAEALAAAYRRNREHLARWEPVRDEHFFTTDGQLDTVARQLSLVQGGLMATWLVRYGDDVVARVNLNNIVRGALWGGSVGYWVDHAHLRRGVATAAVEHACHEALGLGLHRLEAGTMLHNEASQRVLERAGFAYYGTATHYLYLDGAWQDHRLYERILHDRPL